MKKNKTMKTLSFNIIPYYSRLRKNKMYVVSVIEETNANATDSNGLVYSVKSLFEQRDIRYKKEAKKLVNILRKEFNNEELYKYHEYK